MNFFKIFHKETITLFNKFNPLLYIENIIEYIINNIYNVFNNILSNILSSILIVFNNVLNYILYIKLYIMSLFKKQIKFNVNKVILYTNLRNNFNVTLKFKNNIKDIINNDIILNMYKSENISFIKDENIRLKIYFEYDNINYIVYIPYSNEEFYIPYPFYSEDILKNYGNNIVKPLYLDNKKKIYSLFNLESKDILNVKINNIENKNLMNYFEYLKTPFNDFGILYNIPIKLIWILIENNIEIDDFNNFELNFLNMYFDEELIDLKEHFINLNKNDINNFIISNRMKSILQF